MTDGGTSVWLTFSYDGSQHRTDAWGFLPAAAISLTEEIQLGGYLSASTGDDLNWRWDESLQAGAWLSYELGSVGDWAWEATLEASGPSLMSRRGLDVQLSLAGEVDLTESVFAGLDFGTVIATAPLPEDEIGYVFASGWLGYNLNLLTEDHVSLGFYAATHEGAGTSNLLVLEANYTATPEAWETWELTLALGKELYSPFEHDSFYAGFSLTKSF